jgi:hypothetical protein
MHVFNYRLQNDLDEHLADCHENRVDNAVARLVAATGMDAADIRDQLLGMAQEFIDYDKLYRDALFRSNSRSSKSEIEQGIRKAEAAFQTAYEKVFRHAVSPFNPERFDKLVGKTLGLSDLRDWLDGYLKIQGRRLMHRKESDLYEFLMPEALKHDLPPNLRTVVGTFDRKRAIDEPSTQLLAFGHRCIDLVLRHALVPEADGHVALARWKEDGQCSGFVAILLVRADSHAGGGSFRLLRVFCPDGDGECHLLDHLEFTSLKSAEEVAPSSDLASIRARIEDLAGLVLGGLDFIEDRIFWLALIAVHNARTR